MNIALLGYGKMGKEIEAIALQRNHTISFKVNSTNAASFNTEDLRQTDVAIEFSTPHTVLHNIKTSFNAQVPIVVGTTGWYNSFTEIKQECQSKNAALFHATNFSLGVNLFFKLNSYLAELMNKYEGYNGRNSSHP
jgi:4-hydroxy-tetrahydrodipicolinate reductase